MTECGHCGMYHQGMCPRIKAIDYYPDGSVKRIEYVEIKVPGITASTDYFSPQFMSSKGYNGEDPVSSQS